MNITQFATSIQAWQQDHAVRVMIVDDHEFFRRGLREVIQSVQGFEVVAEASNCLEALAFIDKVPTDLVFLDLSLPDGDALQVIPALRKRATPPAIIILSGSITDSYLLNTMLAGASGYLTKDVTASEIISLLDHSREGQLVMTLPVAHRLISLLLAKFHELELTQPMLQPEADKTSRAEEQAHAPGEDTPPTPMTHVSIASLLHLLTQQEEKIYRLMKLGQTNKEIASQLGISRFTVGKHVQNILHKLNATNRTQAASYTAFEGEHHN